MTQRKATWAFWTLLLAAALTLPAGVAMGQDGDLPADDTELAPAPPETDGQPADGDRPAATDGEGGEQTATDGDQTEGEQGAEGPGGPGGGLGNWTLPLILIGAFFLLYFWMGRSRRKQEAKRREMLESLKKGDKVTSIGGIVGTIMEIREDEVVVKVDEANNVRMHFARWAIRGVGAEAKQEKPEDKR